LSRKNYEATYVGQASRKLKTRINEHRNHIQRNTNTESVITDYRMSLDFDWDNVAILDKENFLRKRLISEMLHIKQ